MKKREKNEKGNLTLSGNLPRRADDELQTGEKRWKVGVQWRGAPTSYTQWPNGLETNIHKNIMANGLKNQQTCHFFFCMH